MIWIEVTAMNTLFDLGAQAFNHFWSPLLIWTVMAAGLVLISRLLPRHLPQMELDLHVGVMLALPFALALAVLLPADSASILPTLQIGPASPDTMESVVAAPVSAAEPEFRLPWVEVLGLISIGAFLFSFIGVVRLVRDFLSIKRIIRSATPLSSPVAEGFRVAESSDVRVAFSAGVIRRWIILPAGTDPADQEAIIRHEVTHHLNGDIIRTVLATSLQALLPFHPLVHAQKRRIELLTEVCCDRRLLEVSGMDSRDYAHLLLRHVPQGGVPMTALPLVHSNSQLKQRIEAMKQPIRLPFSSIQMIFMIMLVSLSVGFVAGCSDMEVAPTEPLVTDDAYDVVMELPAFKAASGDSDVFVVVEQSPILLGGLDALQREIQYPEIAKRAGVEGRVYLQMIVDENGQVVDPIITRGIGAGCDEEALRAIKTMKSVPGVQRGQRVKVKMSLPVTFRLNEKSETSLTRQPPPPPTFDSSIAPLPDDVEGFLHTRNV